MLLLGELRCSYEKTFDSEVWSEKIEGMTAEQYVKNNVRDTLEQIAVLEDFADDFSIRLTDEDCDMIAKAADEYMTGCGRLLYIFKDGTESILYDYRYSGYRGQRG